MGSAQSNNTTNTITGRDIESVIESEDYTTYDFGNINFLNDRFIRKDICFCLKNHQIDDFDTIISLIKSIKGLNEGQKFIILTRFKRISNYVNRNYKYVQKYYNISKIFIITTGIVIPALMGVNGLSSSSMSSDNITNILSYSMFYFIWTLQLLLSIISSYINYFKWDKKYFLYMAYKNKIEQEIWLYLELSSRYGVRTQNERKKNIKINHITRLPLFLNRIEYLFKKLKESNYEIEITDEEKQDKNEHKEFNDKFSPSFFSSGQSIPTQFQTPPKLTQSFIGITEKDKIIYENTKKMIDFVQKIIKYKNDFNKIMQTFEISSDSDKKLLNNEIKMQKNRLKDYLNELSIIIDTLKPHKNCEQFANIFNEFWKKIEVEEEIKENYSKFICEQLEISELPNKKLIISKNDEEITVKSL